MTNIPARKRTPSLIERAAAMYELDAFPRPEPAVAERPVATIGDKPALAPSEVDAPAATIPPTPVHALRAAIETAVPDFVPPRIDGGRIEAIDRARLAQMGMIVPGAPVGALAEEFRLVKRQLLVTARMLDGIKARTVLVGSGKPGDGKTYCAINLALSIAAERDTQVVLVDADFAKPDVLARLGLDDRPGLLDALADPTLDIETLIVRTDVPQLSLLPAGAKSTTDTELLASRRTGEILEALIAADPRRIVIFDSPPTLAASPASVLALLVGQVMLVIRADRTTDTDVRRSVALLDGCEHISLVLNAVSFVPAGDRFGSYYGQGG